MITKRIQVFEHALLYIDEMYHDVKFEKHHYVALSKLNTLHQGKYFEIRHNGIKFKHYVGVIQIDGLTIEILPKVDQDGKSEEDWQEALIEMLRVTRKVKIKKVGEADVSKQSIHLLDIYFEWFLSEVQLLLHQGLIKQYYKETSNVKALKGKLEFSGHLQKNLVHKERFYTTHQVYGKDHLIHQVLHTALAIVAQCTKGSYLYSKCKSVQLEFPEVTPSVINETTFTRLPKNRKTAPYTTALAIARLIILNYAPNISKGNERMLALLFDMNALWEEYLLVRLKEVAPEGVTIKGQESKPFWKSISIRPDIVIEKKVGTIKTTFIIDTKWKNIDYRDPSTQDLRQMYVYNEYWQSEKAMLLYPSKTIDSGEFKNFEDLQIEKDDTIQTLKKHTCALGKISIFEGNTLDKNIGNKILNWFGINK